MTYISLYLIQCQTHELKSLRVSQGPSLGDVFLCPALRAQIVSRSLSIHLFSGYLLSTSCAQHTVKYEQNTDLNMTVGLCFLKNTLAVLWRMEHRRGRQRHGNIAVFRGRCWHEAKLVGRNRRNRLDPMWFLNLQGLWSL